VYQWRKSGRNSLPDKVSGVNETVLTIPNLVQSDEGEYYCTVTNEWGNSERSGDVTVSVEGTYVHTVFCRLHYSIDMYVMVCWQQYFSCVVDIMDVSENFLFG